MDINNLKVADGERLYLDGVELKNVECYKLYHSAGSAAELSVTLSVIVNQVASESE